MSAVVGRDDAALERRGPLWRLAGAVGTVSVVVAAGLGALAGAHPVLGAVLVGGAALVLVALLWPLAALAILLSITTLVPFSIQNRFGVGGGTDDPGLLAIDVLLVLALCRAGVAFLRRRWDGPMLLATLLLLLLAVQLLHGVLNGWPVNEVGTEVRRAVLAVGAILLSLHVLDREGVRRRLPAVLVLLGLAVGAWGLTQWYLGIEFLGEIDLGVREEVPLTTTGRGQLQGGLFFFPLAVIVSFAALVSGVTPRGWRPFVWAVLALNGMSLLFTYERTFWAAAVLGCGFVLLREGRAGRLRALTVAPLAVGGLLFVLAVTAPGDLIAAGQRLLSVTQFRTDDSVEYRRNESAAVLQAIDERPLTGHGFGAGITWEGVSSGAGETSTFAHNGYLWLAWKVGILVGLLIVAGMVASIVRKAGARGPSLHAVLRRGAQGALLGLLLINVTFPSFNHLGISVTTGLLLALCWRPTVRG